MHTPIFVGHLNQLSLTLAQNPRRDRLTTAEQSAPSVCANLPAAHPFRLPAKPCHGWTVALLHMIKDQYYTDCTPILYTGEHVYHMTTFLFYWHLYVHQCLSYALK